MVKNMAIVGFHFTNINIQKKKVSKGQINIKNNISIKDVKTTELSLGDSKQKGLRFEFEFVSKYEPEVGEMTLEGFVVYMTKNAEEVAKKWKSEKKVSKEIMAPVLNTALGKCQIEGILLSKEINLPPPVELPKVQFNKKDYIG